MNAELGTVRREDHEGGHSIWVLTETLVHGRHWLCVWSTASGNVGYRWGELGHFVDIGTEIESLTTVIGVVPGTEAEGVFTEAWARGVLRAAEIDPARRLIHAIKKLRAASCDATGVIRLSLAESKHLAEQVRDMAVNP